MGMILVLLSRLAAGGLGKSDNNANQLFDLVGAGAEPDKNYSKQHSTPDGSGSRWDLEQSSRECLFGIPVPGPGQSPNSSASPGPVPVSQIGQIDREFPVRTGKYDREFPVPISLVSPGSRPGPGQFGQSRFPSRSRSVHLVQCYLLSRTKVD